VKLKRRFSSHFADKPMLAVCHSNDLSVVDLCRRLLTGQMAIPWSSQQCRSIELKIDIVAYHCVCLN